MVEARRVVIEQGRAVGVEVERGGTVEVIRAAREVVVAASSINTPKLLMLSGIGDAAHLRAHGVEVVADRPGVGANLQDHLELGDLDVARDWGWAPDYARAMRLMLAADELAHIGG